MQSKTVSCDRVKIRFVRCPVIAVMCDGEILFVRWLDHTHGREREMERRVESLKLCSREGCSDRHDRLHTLCMPLGNDRCPEAREAWDVQQTECGGRRNMTRRAEEKGDRQWTAETESTHTHDCDTVRTT
jgi:hypothetical protein